MCKEYINIQTGEKLDLNKIIKLPDNAMLKVKPELWCELALKDNQESELDIWRVTKGSQINLWWYCDKYDEIYPMSANKKNAGRGCSLCSGYYITKKNSFGTLYPEISAEWNYKLNNGKTPYEISRRTGVKYWWKCSKCKSDYEASPDKRSDGTGCPYCRGLKVNETNCLATTHPELAEMWDYEKNKHLTPYNVVKGTKEKVYWKCKKCNQESHQLIQAKNGCAYCSGQITVKGFNDIATTNSELALLFEDYEESYKYTQFSNQKANFKCPNCDTVSSKIISDVAIKGYSCPVCSVGSFGEQVMYQILKNTSLEFYREKVFKWAKNKRYDFYLPNINDNGDDLIIEIHGEQHYNGSFQRLGGNTLEEEIINDTYKKEIAFKNGVCHYVEIKSLYYDLEFIKEEIRNSELMKLLNLQEHHISNVSKFKKNSLMLDIWHLSNEGLKVMQIVNELNINKTTVRKYLKLGKELGKCNYTPVKRKLG